MTCVYALRSLPNSIVSLSDQSTLLRWCTTQWRRRTRPGLGLSGILANIIPLSDLPDILDGVNPPKEIDGIDPTNAHLRRWEASSFYERILTRAWRMSDPFDVGRGFGWLRKRLDFKVGYGGRDATELRAALHEMPDRLRAVADHFLNCVPIDDDKWLSWHRFREAILFELSFRSAA